MARRVVNWLTILSIGVVYCPLEGFGISEVEAIDFVTIRFGNSCIVHMLSVRVSYLLFSRPVCVSEWCTRYTELYKKTATLS